MTKFKPITPVGLSWQTVEIVSIVKPWQKKDVEKWNGPMQSMILMLTDRKCYFNCLHRAVDIMNQVLLQVVTLNGQPVSH